jgi:hypothetical protein
VCVTNPGGRRRPFALFSISMHLRLSVSNSVRSQHRIRDFLLSAPILSWPTFSVPFAYGFITALGPLSKLKCAPSILKCPWSPRRKYSCKLVRCVNFESFAFVLYLPIGDLSLGLGSAFSESTEQLCKAACEASAVFRILAGGSKSAPPTASGVRLTRHPQTGAVGIPEVLPEFTCVNLHRISHLVFSWISTFTFVNKISFSADDSVNTLIRLVFDALGRKPALAARSGVKARFSEVGFP